MSAALEHYRREWGAAQAALPGARVGWVERVRREALERFCDRGFPTLRDEDWKYTNVRPIERRAFSLEPEGGAGEAGAAPERRVAGLETATRLVFVNGRLAAGHSGPAGERPEGVLVESLARVLDSDPDRVEPHLSDLDAGRENAFAALNRAFLGDGAMIAIPPEPGSRTRSSSCSSRGGSPT